MLFVLSVESWMETGKTVVGNSCVVKHKNTTFIIKHILYQNNCLNIQLTSEWCLWPWQLLKSLQSQRSRRQAPQYGTVALCMTSDTNTPEAADTGVGVKANYKQSAAALGPLQAISIWVL